MAEVRTGNYIAGNVHAFRMDQEPSLIIFESRDPLEKRGTPNQVILHEDEIEAIMRAYG